MKIFDDTKYRALYPAKRAANLLPNRVGWPVETKSLCSSFIEDERPVTICRRSGSSRGGGTTVTLMNGVPIESIIKMLGHTKLSTTMIYARVSQTKIGMDMLLLQNKLDERNSLS